MANKTLEEQARELYPEAEVRASGKKVTEFFEIDLKSDKDGHSNTFKLKKNTYYDSNGEVAGIPKMTFEIDNVLMRMRLFEAVNNKIIYGDEYGKR